MRRDLLCVYCTNTPRFSNELTSTSFFYLSLFFSGINVICLPYHLLKLHHSCYVKFDYISVYDFTEHYDADEAKSYFEANFSHVYFILYDNFIQAENNLRQRGI